MVHDDMYNVKCRQMDTLYESLLFEPFKQIRISHAMFKMTSFIDFGPYFKSFLSLEKYVEQEKGQLTNIVKNSNHIFMEQNLYMVIDRNLILVSMYQNT